jgi:hypothetical protein
MKIGDLVELSAYGKKRIYNSTIKRRDKFGLVVKKRSHLLGWWSIRWYPSNKIHKHSRNEVRFVKLKKRP